MFVSNLITQMMEVDQNRKTGLGARMLSVNFCHPASLCTWLEMSRLAFDVGKRFMLRVALELGLFIFQMLVLTVLIFLKGNAYVEWEGLSLWHWIIIFISLVNVAFFGGSALFNAARINESTVEKIEKLFNCKQVLTRMVSDERFLQQDFRASSYDIR